MPSDETIRKMLEYWRNRVASRPPPPWPAARNSRRFRCRACWLSIQRVRDSKGIRILTRDELSDTIEFNHELLCRQFKMVAAVMQAWPLKIARNVATRSSTPCVAARCRGAASMPW